MVNSGSSANLVLLGALLNLGVLSKGDRIALSVLHGQLMSCQLSAWANTCFN